MFLGEFRHKIDAKGRLIVPSKLRDKLGEEFVATRGLEGCLFLYSKDEWEKIVASLQTLPFTKKDARSFSRFFLSGASYVSFDNQGRINLPQHLISYAHIEKNVVIAGVGDRLEIWNEMSWDDFYNSKFDDMSDIAENLFQREVDN